MSHVSRLGLVALAVTEYDRGMKLIRDHIPDPGSRACRACGRNTPCELRADGSRLVRQYRVLAEEGRQPDLVRPYVTADGQHAIGQPTMSG